MAIYLSLGKILNIAIIFAGILGYTPAIMSTHNKKYSFLLLLVLSLCFLFSFYKEILIAPNSYLFNPSGDGMRGYYAYVYHIKNDSSYLNFEGFNYPYGEHVNYIDGQVLISNTIKFIAKFYPGIEHYSIGIINWLMITSLLFCAIFLYLIMLEHKVGCIYAAISAFAIAMLSPQINRYPAHYALSYSFFIPLTWYLLIRFGNSLKKIKWTILILANNICWFFIHPYLGLILTVFLLAYWLFHSAFQYKNINQKPSYFSLVFLQVIFPVFFFQLIMFLTDHHQDRPNLPYGIFEYMARPGTIFLPLFSPLQPFLNNFFNNSLITLEGVAYIGISSIIGIAVFISVSLYFFFTRKMNVIQQKIPLNEFRILLPAGIIILLFSMAYPFKLHMEFILDWIPPLRQFRSLGRFAWIFYYIITVFTVYFIYHFSRYLLTEKKKTILPYVMLIIIPLLYFLESIPYHNGLAYIPQTKNLFDKKQLDDYYKNILGKIDVSKYQAIIALPFYHEGAEYYMRVHKDKIFQLSQLISFHTALPLLNVSLARTSYTETKKTISLFSPGFYEKKIKNDLESDKPFLVIWSGEELTINEQNVLHRSNHIFSMGDFSFSEITIDGLFYNDAPEHWDNFNTIKDSLYMSGEFLKADSADFFFFDDYESKPAINAYSGKGAYSGIRADYHIIAEIDSNFFTAGQEYIASFWYYNKGEAKPFIFVTAEEKNPRTGESNWNYYTDARFSETIDNDWSLVELNFKPQNHYSTYKILLKGDANFRDTIYIDNLLIQTKGKDVYMPLGDSVLFKNNHLIPLLRSN